MLAYQKGMLPLILLLASPKQIDQHQVGKGAGKNSLFATGSSSRNYGKYSTLKKERKKYVKPISSDEVY